MSDLNPTEKRFEEHIEDYLKTVGYYSSHFNEYDRHLCLIRKQVIDFIISTQPEQWSRLQEIYGVDTDNKILSLISSEISKRGIIDVLRNRVVDHGVYLNLCYFEPKSDLNTNHLKLYQSNHFTVVRQLHYSNQNENSIDMVLFLNGLPIVTVELKNQLTGQNVKHSEKQYRYDRNSKEPLLKFKRCMVHFCVDNNKVSMTTKLAGLKTSFLPFNRNVENPPVDNGYRTKYMWEEILTPSSLLDILENFVHLSSEKEYVFNNETQEINTKISELLIFPRYHQLDLIRRFKSQLKQDGVGKNYLVQHATGSGKSYSIGWLSHTLISVYKSKKDTKRMFDTIIVVTDRTVIDDQLRNTIRSLEKIDGVVKPVVRGSKELKKYLEQGKDIIITTIQKFPFISDTITSLGNQTFAVIIDEVHSSQSGELSKELKKSLSKLDDDDSFDYEEMIRKEIQSRGKQKHISFFGFTGTPKETTLEVFGTKTTDGTFIPFHIYSMYQSIHEGFTLDVIQNYTTYKRYFKLLMTLEDDVKVQTGTGKRALVRFVDLHKMTISRKVQEILNHWINKGSKEIKGQSRGMIVTQSRKHCVKFFHEINRQLKERGLEYHCLIGFSGEVTVDGKKYSEQSCNRTIGHNGNVPHGLKNQKYRLLVVANKFQTGFDEPLVQSMYVDKKLRDVQCVQTLSRLNRTAPAKTHTFVLDFVNEPENIQESFQRFYKSTILEGETDPNRLYSLKREIYDFHLYTKEDVNRFCEVFYNPQRDEGALHPILDLVVDKFSAIEDKKVREDFRVKVQSYIRIYGYLSLIIDFVDIELEKTYVFLKYLNKKLPKRQEDLIDVTDAIDLNSLRIQKIHEQVGELEQVNAVVKPLEPDSIEYKQPEYDFLSELIEKINSEYGVLFKDEDRIDLSNISKKLMKNSEISKIMHEDNTPENIMNFMKEQFEVELVDYAENKVEFYKKLEDNPLIKRINSPTNV